MLLQSLLEIIIFYVTCIYFTSAASLVHPCGWMITLPLHLHAWMRNFCNIVVLFNMDIHSLFLVVDLFGKMSTNIFKNYHVLFMSRSHVVISHYVLNIVWRAWLLLALTIIITCWLRRGVFVSRLKLVAVELHVAVFSPVDNILHCTADCCTAERFRY